MSSAEPSAQDLFAAAREDGPTSSAHAEIWGRVAAATGLAACAGAATGARSATAVKSAIGAKLLAVGGLIGAAGTALGVVLASAVVAPAQPQPPVSAPVATPAPRRVREVASGAGLAETSKRRLDPALGQRASALPTAVPAAQEGASDLAEEAKLVTDARAALVSGDAAAALALVRKTKRLRGRSLEPEELGLEARALHALGRSDEAAAVDLDLRRRYPGHALAR